MSGIARLYTGPEAAALAHMVPCCELDLRLMQSLSMGVTWATNPATRCTICDKPIGGGAAYVVILLPVDPDRGLGVSGGVCGDCGDLPRIQLEAYATRVAILMFEPPAGRA